MTQDYVNGFFTKCAENKVPYDLAVSMYKHAAGGRKVNTLSRRWQYPWEKPREDLNRPAGVNFGTPTPMPSSSPAPTAALGMSTMPNTNPYAPANAQTMPNTNPYAPTALTMPNSNTGAPTARTMPRRPVYEQAPTTMPAKGRASVTNK